YGDVTFRHIGTNGVPGPCGQFLSRQYATRAWLGSTELFLKLSTRRCLETPGEDLLYEWLGPSLAHVVASVRRLMPLLLAGLLIAASLGVPLASVAQTDAPANGQSGDSAPRAFAQTGYRIDRDSF